MEPKVYRQSSCAGVIGGAFCLLGFVLTGLSAYHMSTGTPLMQQTSKFSGGVHAASQPELWLGILGGLPFIFLGLAIVLNIINCSITVDDKGITATNMFKRTSFQADWSQILKFERTGVQAGSSYLMTANSGKELKIVSGLTNFKDLVAEIDKHIQP